LPNLASAARRAASGEKLLKQQEKDAPEQSVDQLALQLARACETEISASEGTLLEQHQAIAALVTADTKR
jgi:hypothetical protein